ncbi:hypothetical protein EW145_g267 [Phellinidium pouzarii]|uniref:Uncharacterized protein n=1 Tax=Phellinidium pouzarii TaxID=167371 RepID=A0A4S4LJ07_9AGAM|nr:hypothetical protein EW145_g267 [Phellinidium pouzarii]
MFGPEADPAKAPSGILNFLSIDFFFKDVKNKERVRFLVEEEESFEATIKSWRENYAGKAQHELLAYMRDYMDKRNEGKKLCEIYYRFPPPDDNVRDYITDKYDEAIVNIRSVAFLGALMDHTYTWVQENCKGHFSYMKAAEDFRDFMADGQTGKSHGEKRIRFYDAVIETSKEYVEELRILKARQLQQPAESSQSTRNTSTQSSTQEAPSSPKYKFGSDNEGHSLADKARKLIESLRSLSCGSGPNVVLAVDEAHVLHKKVKPAGEKSTVVNKTQGSAPTYFSCLRRGLRNMRLEDVFSLFLSTTGNAFQFTPPNEMDSSDRVQQGELQVTLIPPFCDIGFDQLATPVVEDEKHIENIACMEVMVKLGRPMWGTRYKHGNEHVRKEILDFALDKLLGETWHSGMALKHNEKLACLSVRMALDFNPFTGSASTKELDHIEHHLRVCMKVDERIESVKSRASSEPILAEAARKAMNASEDFAAASTLKAEFLRPDIERGARGEAVVELLALLASDMTSVTPGKTFKVVDFLDNLLHSESSDGAKIDSFKKAHPSCVHPKSHNLFDGKDLETAFKDAVMNFSHFTKVSDRECINRKYMWRLMIRGAGVICANGQMGIDIALPFCYYDKVLGRNNVSAIIFQVKNDKSFSVRPQPSLFDAMDPFSISMFDGDCDNLPDGPMPVIRIVAALASNKNFIRNFKFDNPDNSEASYKNASPRLYTAYDIYVGGMHDVWKPIKAQDRADFVQLLDASGSWTDIYSSSRSDTARGIRRSQAPGAGKDDEHWRNWSRLADEVSVASVPKKK